MRKFKIKIHGKLQIIFAVDKDTALKTAKTNLGFKETDVLISNTKEFFMNIEDLIARCEITKKHFNGKAIEIVELWEPFEIKEYCGNLEILRTDGYYDLIYFEPDQAELLEQTYKQLKIYNREITPLEKFHASF
jgi:hypothetical protein